MEKAIVGCLVHLRESQGLRELAAYCCAPLIFSYIEVVFGLFAFTISVVII